MRFYCLVAQQAQTQDKIGADKDQRTQSAIQEIMRINPNAGAAAMQAYLNGGDIGEAIKGFYGEDGKLKAYTEAERSLDARKSTIDTYMAKAASGDSYAKQELLGMVTIEEMTANPQILNDTTAAERKTIAERLGTVSVEDTGGLNQLYNCEGQIVLYQGKPYKVTKVDTGTHPDNRPGKSGYTMRYYGIVLTDPKTNKQIQLYEDKRASNW